MLIIERHEMRGGGSSFARETSNRHDSRKRHKNQRFRRRERGVPHPCRANQIFPRLARDRNQIVTVRTTDTKTEGFRRRGVPHPYRANQIFPRLARDRNQIVTASTTDTKTEGLDVESEACLAPAAPIRYFLVLCKSRPNCHGSRRRHKNRRF